MKNNPRKGDEPAKLSNNKIGYMVRDQMSPSGARYHIMDDTLENRALLSDMARKMGEVVAESVEPICYDQVKTGVPDIRVGINAERPEYKDSIMR